MNEKVSVTLVFYQRDKDGKLNPHEFRSKLIAVAPLEMLLPALLEEYKEVNMGPASQLEILLQIPPDSSLSKTTVKDGSRLIIMPKLIPGTKLVEREDN